MRGRWLAACALLAGCSTMSHNAPVQERSPVMSRENVPPVLTRTPPGQGAPTAPAGSARAPANAAPPPKPPSNSAIAGMAPPQVTGNGDEPVAVATPLKPDGGEKAGAPPKVAAASQAARAAVPAAGASPTMAQIEWAWPVDTPIVQGYNEANKGVDFSGAMGQPVRAAAAGEVSFVGSSLRGYGLMVVIRHERGFMSVYAHNSKILVKVGQKVERGQRIAEMGNTDAKDVVLHFEMRHQGKALDPAQTLPGR